VRSDRDLPVIHLAPQRDESDATLAAVQDVVNRFPLAVQAAVRALVAEGRSYAQTDEGRELKARLVGTPLVRRLRTIWESVSEQAFVPDDRQVLPSVIIDRLAGIAAREDLDPLLSRFFEERL
jgi:hypothetical protein